MCKHFTKLKTNAQFQFVYKRGKSAHARSLVLFYFPEEGEHKFGFTASKKVGNAVVRNRCKRRLRALFAELCDTLSDGRYVLVAKASMERTSYEVLKRDFKYVLTRTGGMADDKNTPS